jgi:hypothetical protein
MRLSISKPQHRSLLNDLAVQLGSDKPTDALEHILNCWMVGGMLPTSATPIVLPPVEPESEFDGLLEF